MLAPDEEVCVHVVAPGMEACVCVCALDEEVRMCVLAPDEEVCACIGSDEEGRARVCWLLMRRCMCMCWPPAQELNASAPCVPA